MDMPITNEFKKDTTLKPIHSLKIVFFLATHGYILGIP